MSKEAVRWAMNDAPMLRTDKGKPDTTSRHVLAALAEHAHPDGTSAYPSVPLLQYKTGYSRRTVQEALGRLEFGGLIRATGKQYDCTVWALAMHLKRPASDKAEIDAETEQRRAATAERVRRHRAKVTPPEGVTVTRSDDVTTPDVTPSEGVSNAVQQRSVTPSDAPKPVVEPVSESLSPLPSQIEGPQPPAPVEREIDPLTLNLMDQHGGTQDETETVLAQVRAEGRIKNLVSWAASATGALDFKQRLADLRRPTPESPAAGPPLPPWCEQCGDGFEAARRNPKFRTLHGQPCPNCHPDHVKDAA